MHSTLVDVSGVVPMDCLPLIPDHHRLRRPHRRIPANRLDIVPIRIQHERCVIPLVVRPFPRRAIVPPAMGHRGLVERIHHVPVMRLERQMQPPGQLPLHLIAIRRGNEQLIRPEIPVVRPSDRNSQRFEHGGIELLAGGQISHHQPDVINQTPLVSFSIQHETLLVVEGKTGKPAAQAPYPYLPCDGVPDSPVTIIPPRSPL